MKRVLSIVCFVFLCLPCLAEDKPMFDTVDEAISYITECVESDDYAKLWDACVGGQHKPNENVIDKLKLLHNEVSLNALYSDNKFPEEETIYKLGGHGEKWHHIHIDFIKKYGHWYLSEIWGCR